MSSASVLQFIATSQEHSQTPGEYGDTITIDLSGVVLSDRPISAIRIMSVYWPYIAYNIMDRGGHKNTEIHFYIPSAGRTINVDVPPGNYSGVDLLNVIKGQFAAQGGGYQLLASWNSKTGLTTMEVVDSSDTPTGFIMWSESEKPANYNSSIPCILELLGYTETSYSGSSSYVSEGPLNTNIDRFVVITCDEVASIGTNVDSIDTYQWMQQVIAIVPIPNGTTFGSINHYTPERSGPIVNLSVDGKNRIFHLNLVRDRYPFFGPKKINWGVVIEVR